MQIIREYYKDKLNYYKDYIKNKNLKISLAIFQVGDSEASNRYVRNKIRDCEKAGITCNLYKYDESVSEEEFLTDLTLANSLNCLTGIIVQLPLPNHISEEKIKLTISPEKDVDGFHPLSKINSATPQGIITYLEDNNYDFVNKNAVVIGRSNIVGVPLSRMLLGKSSNVTTLHSKTSDENKRKYLENADIIFTATGKRHLIDSSYKLKAEAILIDFGMNFDENNKLCGDCDFNLNVAFQASGINNTGLTTRLAVIHNLIKLAE